MATLEKSKKYAMTQTSCCEGVFFPPKFRQEFQLPTHNFDFYAGHRHSIAFLVQGTGIKKWYAAGVGWVDFGQNSGTLQPNHTQTEQSSLYT